MQIEEGTAVSACRLSVANVLSASSEMMWTVWLAQPTAWCGEHDTQSQQEATTWRSDPKSTHEEERALATLGHLTHAHARHAGRERLAVLVLVEAAVDGVELKINELVRVECDTDLALVGAGGDDRCPLGCGPLLLLLAREHVPDLVRRHLEERVGAELLDSQRRGVGPEARVVDLLNRFADRQDERAVDEREDNVRVVLV